MYKRQRLGWDEIRGLPIRPDANVGTGRFRIVCGGEEPELEEEAVEAVSDTELAPIELTPVER